MVEIFNYSSSVYEKHSLNTKAVNEFKKEVHMEGFSIREVAKHAQILDMNPKPSALSCLMQTNQKACWASFSPPKNFFKQRFSTPYLVSSLGSPDRQDEDMEKITAYLKLITKGRFHYRSQVRPFFLHHDEEDAGDQHHQHEEEEELNQRAVEEGKVLLKVLDHGIKSSNIMIDYIISRIFQFVQG